MEREAFLDSQLEGYVNSKRGEADKNLDLIWAANQVCVLHDFHGKKILKRNITKILKNDR